MIVQPSSIEPRSRGRRALRAAGLVLPVVILGAVIGAGLAGPSPEPEAAASTPASVPPGTAAPAIAGEPSSAAIPGIAAARWVFPGRVAGLQVHGVRWTLDARSRGLARGVIAIAGYLRENGPATGCGAGDVQGNVATSCERTAVLAADPWSGGPLGERELPPFHLHAQFPAGIREPSQASLFARSNEDPSPAVVVIARFDDPRATPCVPEGRHCGQELVVERVAWVLGLDYPSVPTVDPNADTSGRPNVDLLRDAGLAEAGAPADGYPLLTAYVLPAMLARVDATAAAGLPPGRAVWYVRVLHRVGDPGRIDWFVIDPRTRHTLIQGSVATSRFALGGGPRGTIPPPGG